MLQNLGDIAGSYPIIRAGGTTQNRNTYVANQTEALIARFSTPGADQPASLTVGPAWFESFQQFPDGTKYIYGLNFYDGDEGMAQAVLQAGAAYRGIGKDLYAFEIGNEVNCMQSLNIYLMFTLFREDDKLTSQCQPGLVAAVARQITQPSRT